MPVRSLSSSVAVWPDARRVDEAVRRWATGVAKRRGDVRRIGYFGSYARGDWGFGSDLESLRHLTQSRANFSLVRLSLPAKRGPLIARLVEMSSTRFRSLGGEIDNLSALD